MEHDYLTEAEAADFCRRKPNTLAKLRCENKGPKYCQPSAKGNVLYKKQDLVDWLEGKTK